MSGNDIAISILLGTGVLGFAITSLGLLLYPDLYDQIHFVAPGSLIGCVAIPAAVIVHSGFQQDGAKAILIGVLLLIANPVLSHATARAGRIRRKQQVMPQGKESLDILLNQEEMPND